MGTKKKLDIEFSEITDKTKSELLKSEKANSRLEYEKSGDYYYRLSDGRVIFEVAGVKNYLFKRFDDFLRFNDDMNKPRAIDDLIFTYTHPINDRFFVERVKEYASSFIEGNGLRVDVQVVEDLEKVDELLNNNQLSKFKENRLSLIALVGEFVLNAYRGNRASWKYLNFKNGVSEREPIILVDEKMLIDPATIVNEEYNKKSRSNQYKISLYRSVKKIVEKN